MADPMEALRNTQRELEYYQLDSRQLDADGYLKTDNVFPDGMKRFSYMKIVGRELQAIAIFLREKPINGVDCYNVNYAVSEKHRGNNLAVEAVNKGIEDLKKRFAQTAMKSFYVDAIVNEKNIPSIKVAEKIFPDPAKPHVDYYSKTPSLYFRKLIVCDEQ